MNKPIDKALDAVKNMSNADLPVMPWIPTSAMLKAAMKLAPIDEATVVAIYCAMLEAYGNEP
jgi:hypothetical protein